MTQTGFYKKIHLKEKLLEDVERLLRDGGCGLFLWRPTVLESDSSVEDEVVGR